MPSNPTGESQALARWLKGQREHVLEAVEGLGVEDLRRQVLPSGWTCLGLVNHLSLDVERFWFQAVVAGEQPVIEEVLASSNDAWNVRAEVPPEDVLGGYRDNIERADAVMAGRPLDAAPAWWPEFFGSWRLHSVREVVLHVMTETATHAGHLDAARELIDGKLHLVLAE
ncbi:MAG TPA: DinB family protein [Acidimicrobiales bacterium]|nr:DinB family protein [Acidimicrobiales bacterium]